MCITEYDEELHERTLRAESIAEGELIAIRKMIDAGIEKEVILKMYSRKLIYKRFREYIKENPTKRITDSCIP